MKTKASEHIRKHRERSGLSLANYSHQVLNGLVTYQTVKDYEGGSEPGVTKALAIAKILDFDPWWWGKPIKKTASK